MTVAKLKIGAALLGATTLLTAALAIRAYTQLAEHEARPRYRAQEADVVDLAFQLSAQRADVSVEKARRFSYATVVRFPDRRCVQLAPPRGAVGGREVYCFSEQDRSLMERHLIGE
jgi:hypothetical protein